jgi:YidC/Oxa1 family membrane protein insertase
MNGIYEFFNIFGVQNIALTIIIFTFIARALMLPLTIKQQKFTKLSSRMNPELQKIQAKYKGKKDEASLRKQQTETQAVYQKYGASPTAGCLPLLITLPIMFALYSVINNIPAYVIQIKEVYNVVAEAIKTTTPDVYIKTMTDMAAAVNVNVSKFSEVASDNVISNNHIIDILSKFKPEHWDQLSSNLPAIQNTIMENAATIKQTNSLFGILNIADNPGWGFPGIIIPFLAMALQFVQTKQLSGKTKVDKDNPTAAAMNSMNTVMPIMSGVFCVMLPIGVGLYWIAGSLFAIIQQFFVNRYMDHINVDELIEKSVMKANKRKAKLAAATGQSLTELASKQTKSIETTAIEKESSVESDVAKEKEEAPKKSSSGTGSISEIANLLKNRSNEKGDK